MKPYMYNADDLDRVRVIQIKIIYILDICDNGIIAALEDEKTAKPAIMMHLPSILNDIIYKILK